MITPHWNRYIYHDGAAAGTTTISDSMLRQAFAAKTALGTATGTFDVPFPIAALDFADGVNFYAVASSTPTDALKNLSPDNNIGRLPFIRFGGETYGYTTGPVITMSNRTDGDIYFLINPDTNWGIAYRTNTTSDVYLGYKYIFSFTGTTITNIFTRAVADEPYIAKTDYGYLYKFWCIGTEGSNSNIAQAYVRYETDASSGVGVRITLYRYGATSDTGKAISALLGSSSMSPSELVPTTDSPVVKIENEYYQLYCDYNWEQTSGRASFASMRYAGQVIGTKVTLNTDLLDPFCFLTNDFFQAACLGHGYTNTWGMYYSYIYDSSGWAPYVTEQMKDLVSVAGNGTRTPGGGDPNNLLAALTSRIGGTVVSPEWISEIPNPATTNTNSRKYRNCALVSPSLSDKYISVSTEGGLSVANADPKALFSDYGFRLKSDDSYVSTSETLPIMSGNFLCPSGYMYWQGIYPFNSGTIRFVSSKTGNAIMFGGIIPIAHTGVMAYMIRQTTNYTIAWTEYPITGDVAAFYGNSTPIDPNDNNPSGPTTPEMEPGSFDTTSDVIPDPSLPGISVTDAGLVTIFNPDLSQLRSLSNYMWSNLTTADGWADMARKIFADPMQYLIALNILPLDIPNASTPTTIKLAGISTGVSMNKATSQFVTVSCGFYTLKEFWGSALDYSPTTKIWLFLPYVGTVPLDPDFVMNTTISIKYKVDILTGAFVALVYIDDSVMYHYNGNMATNVPLTGADYSRFVSSLLSVAGSVALTAVGGAVGGAAAASGLGAAKAGVQAAAGAARATNAMMAANAPTIGASMMNGASAPLASNMLYQLGAHTDKLAEAGMQAAKAGATSQLKHTSDAIMSAGRVALGYNTVNSIMASKPAIAISGQMSSCSGLMDIQYPYLIIQRPNQALPENYKHYVGYPSHMLADVQSCSGYTIFEQIELSGIPCSDDELSEIYEILKGGFYGSS